MVGAFLAFGYTNLVWVFTFSTICVMPASLGKIKCNKILKRRKVKQIKERVTRIINNTETILSILMFSLMFWKLKLHIHDFYHNRINFNRKTMDYFWKQ